jgi:tRNA A-37 threonylcarbamoyl transferase component Bud32
VPDEPRVQELLAELFDRQATPEEVCGTCPDLLPVVRGRWRQICQLRAELDALLPIWPHESPPTPPTEEMPLPQVPGYEVESVLGHGGMGVVYRARHPRLDRLVALKMALAGSYAGPHERERFRREAEAVAALRHPNVVQVYDVGDTDGRPYFTMELMEGGSLARQLAGAPQPARQAAALLATLAGAVRAAHEAGVVHRDLKPGNVLLTADGTPKVADFGLARRLDADERLTLSGAVLGTPSYTAPEQACGDRGAVGPRTDVYALGAILYECLTGRPPFQGETAAATMNQVITYDPVPPSRLNFKVPRDLETICLKCLQKAPSHRYASAAALADDLRGFEEGRPIQARPVGRLEKTARWVHRNPTVAGLSAVAALALVAVAVVSLLFGIDARRKADKLEVQTKLLQAQTQRAEENKNEATRAMLAGLLIPIGHNPHPLPDPLDAAEQEALRQLQATSVPIRFQFLEMALRDPQTARRVGRRADWVVQAVVGRDPALRADVGRLLVRRIQEPGAPQEVALACARLGLAVNLGDRVWAERSAAAVVSAVRDPLVKWDDHPWLAESLVALSEHLPPDLAADHAGQATDAFLACLQDPLASLPASETRARAIVAMSLPLDAAAATSAKALVALLRRPATDPVIWPPLCRALVAVCRRLPPADAAAYVNESFNFILAARAATKEKGKAYAVWRARALGALGGSLDAARATHAAEAILAILSDLETVADVKYISNETIVEALTAVAKRLDAQGRLRAAEGLVFVLRKADNDSLRLTMEPLRAALVSVCRRPDAAGAARVSEAIVAAVRDPQTSVRARVLLADALVVVVGRLDPAGATSLEDALVDSLIADLADAKSLSARELLGQALASVCGRPGARRAPRAAEALTAAIRDPQTPIGLLKPLAVALAAVSGQLPPTEASSHVNQAVDVLGSLWVARIGALDRACLAEALAALLTRLDPRDAAARARTVAAQLEAAFRDANDDSRELYRLVDALAAVYGFLDPAERAARGNSVADALVAALRRPRNGVGTINQLSKALAMLSVHLDRPGAARVADALFTTLVDRGVQNFAFVFQERMFKKGAARLDERDLERLLDHPFAGGRLQRVILDVLGEAKHRHFRNTWDYLDWIESQ